jgi:ABC-2 type transport system ATP-binding protein
MSAPAVRCENLSRWYGEVQGLSGLTATLSGGVVGLLGPNGSGKSTFMRLLTGLIRPSRGYVELFGTRMGPDSHEIFRRVGHAPGEDTHFETETARVFLEMLAALGGARGKEADTSVMRALEEVGMQDKADVRLDQMSKGMRQRIKVAQALLFDPELLLLDEPLNGMDPVSRRKVMDLVRRWGADGRLLAEGRLAEIRDLVDRKPRRVTLAGPELRATAAEMLAADLVSGLSFEGDRLHLETGDLGALLDRLQQAGREGRVAELDIEDESLEAVFDLLVGGAP